MTALTRDEFVIFTRGRMRRVALDKCLVRRVMDYYFIDALTDTGEWCLMAVMYSTN